MLQCCEVLECFVEVIWADKETHRHSSQCFPPLQRGWGTSSVPYPLKECRWVLIPLLGSWALWWINYLRDLWWIYKGTVHCITPPILVGFKWKGIIASICCVKLKHSGSLMMNRGKVFAACVVNRQTATLMRLTTKIIHLCTGHVTTVSPMI